MGDEVATKYGCLWSFTDMLVALVGQLDRQGYLELLVGLPLMISVIPIYKYCLSVNPFTHRLQEVFVNQWSDPVDATGDGIITGEDRRLAVLKHECCTSLLAQHYPFYPYTGYVELNMRKDRGVEH